MNPTTNPHFNHEDIILFVPNALQHTPEEIVREFQELSIARIRYCDKQETQLYVELRFDPAGFTATCYFTNDQRCHIVHLFPDTPKKLNLCIDFLLEQFSFHQPTKEWILPHCKIQPHRTTGEMHLIIYTKDIPAPLSGWDAFIRRK